MSEARLPTVAVRVIVAWVLLGLGMAWQLTAPIPQPEAYHRFFDQSTCFGVRHCHDTLSNIPFIIVGLVGAVFVGSSRSGPHFIGAGEKAPYLLVPVLLWAYPARYRGGEVAVAVMALYALALLCDRYDRPIAEALGFVSGHTLKHLVGALAAAVVLLGVARRRAVRG